MKIVILISIAVLMVGFAFYGLAFGNRREDISSTSNDSNVGSGGDA